MEGSSRGGATLRCSCGSSNDRRGRGMTRPKPGEGSALLDFAGRTERRLHRVRRIRVPPHSLTDLAGLRLSAEQIPRRRGRHGRAADLGCGSRRRDRVRQPGRDHGARLRERRGPARAPPSRDDPPQAPGRDALSGCGVPDAAPANLGRDRRARSGLVLPARRLEVSRLVCLGADRDAGGSRRGRALRRHRGPLAGRAGAAASAMRCRGLARTRCRGSRPWWPASSACPWSWSGAMRPTGRRRA